jgi:NADPH-dependent 2,4-dienoyl-CoA reductase/sulfur reductase-like enzyme
MAAMPLRIIIVGGVAGGMSAATRARRLDETASINVFERGAYVSFANCGIPYQLGGIIKDESALILQTPTALKERFNIDVHTNSEVIELDAGKKLIVVRTRASDTVQRYPYDKLILSQGAEAFHPKMDGVDSPNVFTLQTIPDLQGVKSYIYDHGSNNIAIIGAGFIGVEAADALHDLGMKITLLEYAPHVFPLLDADITQPLHTEIRANGVNLLLKARISAIVPPKDGQPGCIIANGQRISADVVILAAGIRARLELAKQANIELGRSGVTVNEYMQTSDPDIYAVGDMVETEHRVAGMAMTTALAGPANRQGRLAADNIFGRKIKYRGNVGTSACKVFGLTVASTGLAVHTLRSMGMQVQWVTVHPPDHAGYYPGASQVRGWVYRGRSC